MILNVWKILSFQTLYTIIINFISFSFLDSKTQSCILLFWLKLCDLLHLCIQNRAARTAGIHTFGRKTSTLVWINLSIEFQAEKKNQTLLLSLEHFGSSAFSKVSREISFKKSVRQLIDFLRSIFVWYLHRFFENLEFKTHKKCLE